MDDNKNIYISDDMLSDEEYLEHYGTPRHSGRYPWGSGDEPYQHSRDFLNRVEDLEKQGFSQVEIAHDLGMSTTDLRTFRSLAISERKAEELATIKSMKADGKSNVEIATQLYGDPSKESTVRSKLKEESQHRVKLAEKTADNLKDIVDERGIIDIGKGTEKQLGISQEKMKQAVAILQDQGYVVYDANLPQVTNKGQYTRIKVLCPPGTEYKEVYADNFANIHTVEDLTTRDNGNTLEPSFRYPAAMDVKRVKINYGDVMGEDGHYGKEMDGTMLIRPGVKDANLGESNYSQIRVLVGENGQGTHYLKGMAVYGDPKDFPDGVDIIFNTNKKSSKPAMGFNALGEPDDSGVFKPIKKDPENPFGSSIKEHGGQTYYDDPNGKYTDPVTGHKQSLNLINKKSDEGDWNDWADTLPSQFLSKQPMATINKQLSLTKANKQAEFDEIMSVTNPTVKRELLKSYADDCDTAAVNLKAASFPGQKYRVILPLKTISENECYNPTLPDGTTVALVRYPHGGTFEIPILKVNNRNPEGQKYIHNNAADAVGISSKVAERLSGADFDGDTVMVIPFSNRVQVKNKAPLEDLKNFDSKSYQGEAKIGEDGKTHYYYAGKEFKLMNNTQNEMGKISNLITDMTIKGASDQELARAVKHSMVVIDAEKHHLDYNQSYKDNNIQQLKNKYQQKIDDEGNIRYGGAGTLLSRAKSPLDIPERADGAFYTKDGKHTVSMKTDEMGSKLFVDDTTGEILDKKTQVRTLYTDPKTGAKLYHDTGRTYLKTKYRNDEGKLEETSVIIKNGQYMYKAKGKNGTEYRPVEDWQTIKEKPAMAKSTKMAETNDARTLSSGTPQENAYADYANYMKDLANKCRLEAEKIKDIPYSPASKAVYQNEFDSLSAKVLTAQKNAPRERRAQALANSVIVAKKREDPTMTDEHEKKIRQQAIASARAKVGASRQAFDITDREWEAIQAGAISATKVKEIVRYADSTRLRQLATPRQQSTMSTSQVSRAKAMVAAGYTTAEIAQRLGKSPSTITKYVNE